MDKLQARSPSLPVICLGGPTGSGKTGLAIKLAEILGCEIINADSRQLYADFPIITAQPTAEEQAAVPHHLYGYLPSDIKSSAGQWVRHATARAGEILARKKIPLLVGGTGLYFHALLNGLAEIPPIDGKVTRELARRMERDGARVMHAELANIDPAYAASIHPNDRQRILRALEVYLATGKTFSRWHSEAATQAPCRGYFYFIDVPLQGLEQGLASRIDQMLAQGALVETARAWETCPDASAPAWSGIGCRECLACYQQKIDLFQCRKLWLASTRAYAKRQLTWFRGRPNARGITPAELPAMCNSLEKWWTNPQNTRTGTVTS